MINITDIECLYNIQLNLQCKYTALVKKYTQYLKYTICTKSIKKDLIILNSLISLINKYDIRDIELNTYKYNSISINNLNDFINYSCKIFKKYD